MSPRRRGTRFLRGARIIGRSLAATVLLPAALSAQDSQVLAALRGETGVDPAPGTLLATISMLSIEQAPLAEALARLAEQSNVQIAFSPSLLPGDLRVDCDCTTLNLARALDRLLADTDLGYVELGSQVVVVPRAGSDLAPPDGLLRGRVRSEVAVPIEDATVRLVLAADTTHRHITGTDRLGYFAFHELTPGRYTLSVARIGYALHEQGVDLVPGSDLHMEVALTEQAVELAGVLAEGRRSRQRERYERSGGVTVQEMNRQELKAIPGVAEPDPMKSVEVLPGVTRVSDFTAAFNVRGGSADQNLILLDGMPIFNPFHAMGLFSVFNGDMVQRAELHSGGFPAEFGGRTSSVLRVESDLGDGELGVDAGVSLIASRAAVRGGLSEDLRERLGLASARWRVSGRRSYLDVLTRPFLEAPFPYRLNDLQGAFEAWTRNGDRVRITGYSGRDIIDIADLAILGGDSTDEPPDISIFNTEWRWGNDAVGASWTRPLPDGGAVDLHGSLSRFNSNFEFDEFGDIYVTTRISRAALGGDVERRPAPRLSWKSGGVVGRLKHHNTMESWGPDAFPSGREEGVEAGVYSQIRWNPNSVWLLEGGLRLDHWRPGDASATTVVSPRFALKRFVGDGSWAVRTAAGRYSQFILSVRDEKLPVSPEWWMLSGAAAPVLVSEQLQAGFEGFAGLNDDWFVSLEGYYRRFEGLAAQDWADDPDDPTDDLMSGKGRAYGADLMIRRDLGEITGWLSVSLLKAEHTFRDTGSGLDPAPLIRYAPVFDRRLDVDLVLRRNLPWGVETGLRWNFGTGLPYTRPLGHFSIYRTQMVDLLVDPTYATGLVHGPRNGERYPVQHRLDVTFRRTWEKGWGRITPYLNVINAYNRKNVLFYSFNYRPEIPVRNGVSMLPILPTIGVEVSF
ncbi:MAG: TonB-dependent receptor [Gemmatimonadetes bacterium]|nr:TonB-dependent receptor [Gemmatimonadota bacterium]